MKLARHIIAGIVITLVMLSGCSSSKSVPADEAAEVWYNLGNAYTKLGQNDDAVKAYMKARQLNPELVSAGFNLARIRIMQERYDDSLKELDELLEIDPQNRLLLETRAWVMHLKGDDEAALEIYEGILSIFADSRNALYNSALLLTESGYYERAKKRFKRLVELYPEEKSAVFEIARIEALLENNSEALKWLDMHFEDYPDDLEALELAGDLYSDQKNYQDAVSEYEKIIDILSAGTEAEGETSSDMLGRVLFKKSEILLVQMENSEVGLDDLRRSIELGVQDREGWDRLLSYIEAEWYEDVKSIIPERPEEKETPDSADEESGAE